MGHMKLHFGAQTVLWKQLATKSSSSLSRVVVDKVLLLDLPKTLITMRRCISASYCACLRLRAMLQASSTTTGTMGSRPHHGEVGDGAAARTCSWRSPCTSAAHDVKPSDATVNDSTASPVTCARASTSSTWGSSRQGLGRSRSGGRG